MREKSVHEQRYDAVLGVISEGRTVMEVDLIASQNLTYRGLRRTTMVVLLDRPAFPSRRKDGSMSVASRYSVSSTSQKKLIVDHVAQWIRERPVDEKERLRRELLRDPYVVERRDGLLDIVVEGRPGSRLWKEYLAEVVRDVPHLPGIAYEGFWDLVTNRVHPASLVRRRCGDNWPTDPL
jgi:hypothetical protein